MLTAEFTSPDSVEFTVHDKEKVLAAYIDMYTLFKDYYGFRLHLWSHDADKYQEVYSIGRFSFGTVSLTTSFYPCTEIPLKEVLDEETQAYLIFPDILEEFYIRTWLCALHSWARTVKPALLLRFPEPESPVATITADF